MLLITGGTGFIGKYIVQEFLSAGYDIRLLVRNPAKRTLPSWSNLVEIAEGDILDQLSLEKALDGVTEVVHAAGKVSFWRKEKEEIMAINQGGTALLVDLCLAANIQKLVHVSSIAAIGHRMDGGLITEDTPWGGKSLSHYSLSKRRAEMEVYRGIAEGLQAVMVNPALVIGADSNWDEGTAKMYKIVNRGLSFYNPGGNGFVAAADVAKACRLLLEENVPNGERYLLAAENLSYQTYFSWVAEALGKRPPSRKLGPFLTLTVGRISEFLSNLTGKPPIVSLETMRSGLAARAYDGSKITGLEFSYQSIHEVVNETARQFQADKTKQA
ncbi:MAG: NAD-dependent epimerase/dehydratase family protein [Bacteroidota bacterium]